MASANRLGYKHKKVQRLRRVFRQTSFRESERVFVAEGAKLVREAFTSGANIESVFLSGDAERSKAREDLDALIAELSAKSHRIFDLEPGVMERVAETVTPQPIAAMVAMNDVEIDTVSDVTSVVVLVDVRDPGNAGTIIRSAEAAGFGGVVVCDGSVDVFNPKTVRASAGSLFHLSMVRRVAPGWALEALSAIGFVRIGTAVAGDVPDHDDVDLTRKFALVLGNEAQGLSDDTVAALDEMLTVPIRGRSESLNVSMAMTAIAFEAARQRKNASTMQ